MLTLLPRWQAEGRTAVAALHDSDQVRRYFPSTLKLDKRAAAWGPTATCPGAGAMTLHALLIAPFADFAFMRRALIASLALSVGAGPIGTLLILRRMSLMGDALSHAILPGAALGFLVGGLSLPAMVSGGAIVPAWPALAAVRCRASRRSERIPARGALSGGVGGGVC